MTRKQNGLGLTVVVAAGCLALLLLLIALITRTDGEEADPAVGFPLVMGGLIVLATLGALGWRAASKKRESSDTRP